MKFLEVTITTTNQGEELIADILWQYSHYGVAIASQKDIIELMEKRQSTFDYIEDQLIAEDNGYSLVKAYIALEICIETLQKIEADLENLRANAVGNIEIGSLEMIKREVEGDDWIEIWKKHFKPIDLGRVEVCPLWIEHTPKEGQVQIKLDSNMAFGTGEHETTSMVVELMQDYITSESTIIDVGTGSGILGISAVLLGAKKAIMTDIDFVAVKTARHNAELNGVLDKCQIELSNLLDDTSIKGDVVLANITADVLMILSNSIVNNIKKQGMLIMSGIIKSKVDMVIDRYTNLGFSLVKRENKGEWIALVFKN